MLTKRQNLLETIHGGHPDRFVNQYEAFAMQVGNAFSAHNPAPKPGELNVVNAWGVTRSFPAGTPGPFPVHTPDKIVIKDVEEWQKYLKVPNVVYSAQEWEPFIEAAEKVDRNEQFCTTFIAPGVFEQSHYLMEIQNCLMAFYEYPDEMHEILDQITQFELDLAKEICTYIKPDALFHHDDWGSQQSTFLSPEMFREFIKPCYMKIYKYYKDHGVELIVHHSDSYAASSTSAPAPPRAWPCPPSPVSTRKPAARSIWLPRSISKKTRTLLHPSKNPPPVSAGDFVMEHYLT